eukprot:TRINITY_DN11279_c0_g1_i2.p1 TRINITY_DN11279_c0_g1~~TRINITY_DN11279_c0_g1_i2.p1  ORF type:complete len:219 (-),score=44.94 TRINITY_DN11279_c0_g1_i2:475-1131(-)
MCSAEDEQLMTSVMIRNLPSRATEEEIMEKVDSIGFCGTYDFFFLPRRSNGYQGGHGRVNQGYAFINFKSASVTLCFLETVAKANLMLRASPKVLNACYARVQGREHLIRCTAHCRTTCLPWIEGQKSDDLAAGDLLPFQMPPAADVLTSTAATQQQMAAPLQSTVVTTSPHPNRRETIDGDKRGDCVARPVQPMYIHIDHEYFFNDVAVSADWMIEC